MVTNWLAVPKSETSKISHHGAAASLQSTRQREAQTKKSGNNMSRSGVPKCALSNENQLPQSSERVFTTQPTVNILTQYSAAVRIRNVKIPSADEKIELTSWK